jgi:hypothetical protein
MFELGFSSFDEINKKKMFIIIGIVVNVKKSIESIECFFSGDLCVWIFFFFFETTHFLMTING